MPRRIRLHENLILWSGSHAELAHHSAAIIHVVSVFVSVGTEVHTGRDSGKRPSFSPPQPTVTASLLMFHLFQEAKGQKTEACLCSLHFTT